MGSDDDLCHILMLPERMKRILVLALLLASCASPEGAAGASAWRNVAGQQDLEALHDRIQLRIGDGVLDRGTEGLPLQESRRTARALQLFADRQDLGLE